ncbi:MAG: hypothetical protein DHS20C15_09600 [Planctomycetota bacterium]|nr:MAG: hypothetical protein DHS20C15_09600 [Planctomycetota bacterium]
MSDAVASPSSSTHPLLSAAEDGTAALESVWLESLADPPPADIYLRALEVLPEAARRNSAGSLLNLLLEALQKTDRHGELLPVLAALGPHRPANMDLLDVASTTLKKAYGNEEWYELFLRISDIEGMDPIEGLERFERLLRLLPGSPVYHRSGWGEGVITGLRLHEESFEVTFTSEGRARDMPFTTGLDVLEPLALNDLRARLLVDLDGLKQEAVDDPSLLVRAVARLHKNKAGAKEIKERLCGTVIEASSWASWWRKAKTAASRDPYLAVENPARPVFILRKRALSPEEEIRQQLEKVTGLGELLGVVRGPLGLDATDGVTKEMIDALEPQLEDPENGNAVERIEAALLLVKHERWPIEKAGELVAEIARSPEGLGPVLKSLKPPPLRREAWLAFVAAEPQLWSDALVGQLADLPPQVLDLVSEKMVQEGRGDAVSNRFRIFLMFPSRQVDAVLRLSKRFAAGMFDKVENSLTLTEVVMGLLHLAETQAPLAARDDREARKAVEGVEDLLFLKKSALGQRFGKEATKKEMTVAMSVLARCRTMPSSITAGFALACNERFPDLVPRDDTPFWEDNFIYVTSEGLARREREYRTLIDEKIPENSEVIGKAAAFGDLSENYEWTAAIEQQRQLTEKAAAMEAELKLARLIEEQEVEEGVAAPGMQVTYDEGGKTKVVKILGPWDLADGVISYKAPVAAGLLGTKAGESATLELPGGDVEVQVKSIESAL